MTKTERQQIAIKRWIQAKGKGTFEFPTAFGKTFTAITAIKALRKKYPDLRVLVVVPTTTLKEQWETRLAENDLYFNIEVWVINTVIKHEWVCDLLVIDEYHVAAATEMSQVFKKVKYKLIMGLTATFERLDGKHALLERYAPIVDVVTTIEAIVNNWISTYKEYQVLIDVDNLEEYKDYHKAWLEHFEFFNYDFGLAMSLCGKDGWKKKLELRDIMYKGNSEEEKKQMMNLINFHSAMFMKTMQKRKSFIYNHPKKIEIARKIMQFRPDSKIITFSQNAGMADALENGNFVYTGTTSKKKGRVLIEDYLSGKIKHLHSCKKLVEGFDDPNTEVAIILGHDSSERRAIQTRGRVIRLFEGKNAEIFNLVINNTQDTKWFSESHKKNKNYITIDENGLDKVLRGEQPEVVTQKPRELLFRF